MQIKSPQTLSWVQLTVQTVVLLAGFLAWSMAQEHRLTVIEETLKQNREIMETLADNQKNVIQTLSTLASQQSRLEILFGAHVKDNK